MRSLFTIFFIFSNLALFSQNEYFIKVLNQNSIDLTYTASLKLVPHPLKEFIEEFEIDLIVAPFNTKDKNLQNTYVFEVNEGFTLEELKQYLEQYNFIEYIEKVPEYELFYTPNDPLYSQQYALTRIQADLAWDLSTCQGNSNVVVAITDDAVRIDHEDLVNALWNNPNEIPNNGIDDDNNGYIDDVIGWDAADNDNDPSPPANATNSYFSHGTHVAGIAGASTDNNIGIASSSFGVQIMPVKIGANVNGSLTGAYRGVDYTISCGYVDVVNMSWGGGSYSQTYQNLFNAGHNLGITFVAAAGNSNTGAPMYPASYNHVISVAASNQNDVRASFSNYGATIDVSAPGVSILSTVAGATNAYDFKSGTSMASPLVAGLCGLMKCYDNGITPDEIEACLKSTAENIDIQNPNYINQLGAGRVNAHLALQCLNTTPIASFYATDTVVCPNQQVQFLDESAGVQPLTWNWQFPGGTPATSNLQNPTVSYAANGNYTVTLTVTNAFGNDVLTQTNYIAVENPTAVISGNATITNGGLGFLKIDFTGQAPFDFVYTDGTNNITENGITQNPYYIAVTPSQNTTYTLISMNDAYCNGGVSGSGEINVAEPTVSIQCEFGNSYDSSFVKINDLVYNPQSEITFASGTSVNNKTALFSFNREGTALWSKEYNNIGTSGSRVVLADNNDILMSSNTSNSQLFVSRLNPNGDILWSKEYVAGLTRRIQIIGSLGDSYFIVGWYSTGGSQDDLLVMKIDGNGNLLWSYIFDNGDDQFYEAIPNGTGGLVVAGSIIVSGTLSASIVEIDINGNLLSSKKESIQNHSTKYFNVLKDGNFYYAASSTLNNSGGKIGIVKLDSNFDIVWKRTTGYLANTDIYDGKLIKDNHGDFYWLSPLFVSGTVNDEIIVKFDETGSILKSKTSLYNYSTTFFRGINTNSVPVDNLLIAYTSDDFTNGSKVGITRTDTSLNSCFLVDNSLIFNDETSNTTTFNLTRNVLNFNILNNNYSENVLSSNEIEVCPTECVTSDIVCSDLFQKYFDDNGETERINVEYTSDGGYIVTGSTTAYGQGSYDVFAAKFDDNDNLVWSNTYGTAINGSNTGNELSYSVPVVEMDNGDFVFGCESNTYGTRSNVGMMVVFRTDALGNLLWQKTIGLNQDYAHVAKMMKDDNDIVLVGSAGGSLTSGGLDDAYILKIDGNGNELFSNVLIGGTNDHFTDVLKIGNVYYCIGSSLSFSSIRTPYVATFDLNGNLMWSKYYSGLTSKLDVKFILVNNELIILNGTNSNTFTLFKIDLQGNVLGQAKDLLTSGGADINFALEIETFNDSSFIVSGYTDTQNSNDFDLFVSEIDMSFNENWTKLFGETGDESVYFRDNNLSLDLPNNTGLIAGYTTGYGNADKDLFLAKFSLDTIIDCESIYLDYFNDAAITVVANNYTWSVDQLPSLINANFIQATMPLQETVICEVVCEDSTILNPVICQNIYNDTIVCLGDSIQLNAGNGLNYSWQANYNISNALIQNPIVWPEVDTTYIVYYEDDSCQYFDTIHVEVSFIEVNASPEDTTIICTIDDLQLNANGADTYIWTPNADLDNGNIANPIFSGNTSTELIVEGQNLLGCIDSDTVYVNVLPCCGAYADFEASDTLICLGDSILFTNTSINGNNASFVWDFRTNATPNSFIGIQPTWVKFNQPGAYDISLILTDDCGADTAQLTIYVNDLPPTNIANDTSVCGLDTLQYELGDIEIAGNNYTWTPTLGLNNPNIANPTASVTDSATYIVVVEDFYTGCSNTDSIKVKVTSEPDTIIQLLENSLCIGDFATVFVDIPFRDSIVWQNQIINSDTLNLQVFNDTLIYVDIFINECKFSDSILITADTLVNVNLTFNDSICFGEWDTIQVNTLGVPIWNTGDTSYNLPVQIFNDTTFIVATFNGVCANYDTAKIYVNELPISEIIGNDTVCVNTDETFTTINGFTYLWSNGSNGNSANYVIDKDTLITVEISNLNCTIIDSHYVYTVDSAEIEILGNLNYCENDSFLLYVNTTNNVVWSTGAVTDSVSNLLQNDMEVFIESTNGFCPGVFDTVMLQVETIDSVEILGNLNYCDGDSFQLYTNISNDIIWSTGSINDSISNLAEDSLEIYIEASYNYCPNTRDTVVLSLEYSSIEILGDSNYCENEEYLLYVNSTDSLIWSTGSVNDTIEGVTSNDLTIFVDVINLYCPNASDTINLTIDTIPVINIESPIEILENETQQLEVDGNADSWSWSPPYGLSCVNCQNPIVDIDSNMVYILAAENNGCFAYDTVEIILLNLENCLLIPTAFSPNGDGVNDTFKAIVLDDKTIINSFKIYNRWGELIHNNLAPWNGSYKGVNQNIDAYVYVLEYFCDGENKVLSGNVTLIK